MHNNDTNAATRIQQATQALSAAAESGNRQALANGLSNLVSATVEQHAERIAERLAQEQAEARASADSRVLQSRGVRQLTTAERDFYQRLADASRAKDPHQALTNANLILPETVIDQVFEDLRTEHPLLSRINFIPSGAAVKMILNANGYQTAAWGELCDEIVKELTSGFQVVNTTLFKLSAFLPVCKQALDLGPEWLDRYVREVLYEAFANGLELGILSGTGNDQPIGMDRNVGPDASVVGGVYPQKEAITVSSMDIQTVGNLVGLVSVGPNGSGRAVRDLILVVNPADYYTKVMPATTIMAPDGTYRSTMPYPVEIIQSPAVPIGEAIFGLAYRYAAFAGSRREGNIDYSDHYRFLEDERVYLIKGFANGFPMDNAAFLRLDISGLTPRIFQVDVVNSPAPSDDATLSTLSLGAAALSPAFDPETTAYTATTTSATNTISAVPSDAGAVITIVANDKVIANGSAITWATGTNTVVVAVTAEDGIATERYTITVTKS